MADPATLLSLALLLARATAQITVFDSINQCCSLGSYRAKAQLDQTCDDISVPVKDSASKSSIRILSEGL